MIPLGWTFHHATLPAGFSAMRADGISVLALPGASGATPRGRLKAQVRLFDAGVDFLPVPPRTNLSMAAALDAAQCHRDAFLRALSIVGNHGQMSLAVSWQDARTPCAIVATGRTWLKTRQTDLRRAERLSEQARDLIGTLARATGLPTSPIQTRRSTAQACLLVPRRDVAALKSAIASHARACTTSSLTLTITGPWPPSAFVPVFETAEGMAA